MVPLPQAHSQEHIRRKPVSQSYGSSPPPCRHGVTKAPRPPSRLPGAGGFCRSSPVAPGLTISPMKETYMTVATAKAPPASPIRPFTIDTPEADLEDLRARIRATRWPEKETVADIS